MEEQTNTNNELNLGTQYEFSKNMVAQLSALEQGVINSKKEILMNYLRKIDCTYYMLLCNERKDYTVFRVGSYNEDMYLDHDHQYKELINILVDECLVNRGEIRGIDLTENKDAVEIWLYIDEEAFVYYFFPYDNAVIEV